MTPLPQDFVSAMRPLLGSEAEAFFAALDSPAPVSIRRNPNKPGIGTTVMDLPTNKSVPWCPLGTYLAERPSFTNDPVFHAGGYYVQEASSMFLWQLKPLLGESPVRALDLCASPGGKSTLLTNILPEGSVLVSNEVIHHRANILAENMIKWGYPTGIVTEADPDRLKSAGETFDFILVDAPCSGEGMFRKDEAARSEWSLQNVELCARRQQRILSAAWEMLQPGGLLAYSTCTFNTIENEDNLAFLIDTFGAEPVALDVLTEWQIAPQLKGEAPAYRFFPHKVAGEGFFFCLVRKPERESVRYKQPKNKEKKNAEKHIPHGIKCFVHAPEKYEWRWMGDEYVHALTPNVLEMVECLKANGIRLHTAGITVGMQKGKDLVPAPALALSTEMDDHSFFDMEFSRDEALSYLARQSVTTMPDLPLGFVLATFRRRPLGFLKNLGTRANNLYPQDWRIRNLETSEDCTAAKD